MERRVLVPFEVAALLALAFGWSMLSISELVPYAFPLLALAILSRRLRDRDFAGLFHGHAAIGALVGAAALGLAILAGTPLVEIVVDSTVEWGQYGFVRGAPIQIAIFAVYVGVAAFCAELALRGWIVERVLEAYPAAVAILVAAIAEALLVPGGIATRIGAAIFGAGLGWIYVAGNRNLTPPIIARVVFAVGALLLDGFQIIG